MFVCVLMWLMHASQGTYKCLFKSISYFFFHTPKLFYPNNLCTYHCVHLYESVWLGPLWFPRGDSGWNLVGAPYKSQISERCQWDALNVVIPTATQSPLMGSGWDCTCSWNCVYVCEPEHMCVRECEYAFLLCLRMEAPPRVWTAIKSSPVVVKSSIPLIFLGFRTTSLSHMNAPDVSPA